MATVLGSGRVCGKAFCVCVGCARDCVSVCVHACAFVRVRVGTGEEPDGPGGRELTAWRMQEAGPSIWGPGERAAPLCRPLSGPRPPQLRMRAGSEVIVCCSQWFLEDTQTYGQSWGRE